MERTYKKDHILMDILKVNEITRLICETNMGSLKLRLRRGETIYRFVLDAVELDVEQTKELFDLLYPVKEQIEKIVEEVSISKAMDELPNTINLKLRTKKIIKKNGKAK